MPGVAFDLSNPQHGGPDAAATSGASPGSRPTAGRGGTRCCVGDPPKKIMTRYMPRFTPGAKVDYYPLYHMNVATDETAQGLHGQGARRDGKVLTDAQGPLAAADHRRVRRRSIPRRRSRCCRSRRSSSTGRISRSRPTRSSAKGMVDAVIARAAGGSVGAVPARAGGRQVERAHALARHHHLTAETALRVWTEIGESVARAGLRKLVIVTSHGGNVDMMRHRGARAARQLPDAGGDAPAGASACRRASTPTRRRCSASMRATSRPR